MSELELKPVKWKGVVNNGGTLEDFIIYAVCSDDAIETACKIAERLGGDFTDIVSVELIG